jgi:hypothetical protein
MDDEGDDDIIQSESNGEGDRGDLLSRLMSMLDPSGATIQNLDRYRRTTENGSDIMYEFNIPLGNFLR